MLDLGATEIQAQTPKSSKNASLKKDKNTYVAIKLANNYQNAAKIHQKTAGIQACTPRHPSLWSQVPLVPLVPVVPLVRNKHAK